MAAEPAPVAQQARSRLTRGRILDASLSLIAEGGADALTISTIAERAGVSVGSVYRRFGDKDRLLLSVQGAFADRVRDDVAGHLARFEPTAEATSREIIDHVVWSFVESFRAHDHVLKVFLVLGLQNPAVYEAGSRASRESRPRVEAFLARVEIARPDRQAAVDFTFRLLYSTLAHRVTQGEFLESDRPLPWPELQARLTDTICGYLLTAV